MNAAAFFSFFMLLCTNAFAQETVQMPKYLLANNNEDYNLEGRHFDFGVGYTTVTQYDSVVKITAEQRFSDNELLVIVFPQEMGISFHIDNVRIGKAPHYNLQGNVAKVTGTFIAEVNMSNPIRVNMTVPVQISPVSDFTVSSDEALIQGNQFYQKKLDTMVTGDEP